MQRTRTALILGVILIANTGVRAQTAHSIPYNECTCPRCAGARGPSSAAGVGLVSWTATVQQTLGGILPGSAGCDARHKIYKAALRRSTFDKKLIPVIPYYEHAFPCYSDRRYFTGPLVPPADCPPDYAGPVMEDGVVPMGQIPGGPEKPTPAAKPDSDRPSSRMVPSEQQGHNLRQSRTRSLALPTHHSPATRSRQAKGGGVGDAARTDTATKSDLGQFISWGGETEGKVKARVDSRGAGSPEPSAHTGNPLRR